MGSILLKVDKFYMQNRIFSVDNPALNRDNSLQPYHALREALNQKEIQFDTSDIGDEARCEKIIVFDLSRENLEYVKYCVRKGWQKKLILVLWEGPVVLPSNWEPQNHEYFEKIFTWDDDYVDNKKYFKIYFPQPTLPFLGFTVPFEGKKLCTMIAGNKMYNQPKEIYSERIEAIRFFEHEYSDQFDLYGKRWDKPVKRLHKVLRFMKPRYTSYRGPVSEKGPTLAKYKYAICYENTEGINGYITEKIFDCFRGGCVPIYLGTDNITDYVPADTFIDKRQFATYDDLLEYLLSITEMQYIRYMHNIEDYLNSDRFKLFSVDNFVAIMLKHII